MDWATRHTRIWSLCVINAKESADYNSFTSFELVLV